MTVDEKSRLLWAKFYVAAMRGFYQHLIIYVVVNVLLILINLLFVRDQIWFVFPLLTWGFGLFLHWMRVFGGVWFLSKDWERRKIDEMLRKGEV
ncbi:2TM domain-containing protein [Tahibacter harae]|uniref:2TM domain-containing protein n=1 Tax=Tahibacter harae TaxID=2963937 RepID=A0ABT1QT67_9GAMM|nr:2TM domain-containing protein [Tahibacter harae]MCQ4165462.1 2TM domain-containing protein [Tahibacter harae]